MKSRYLIMGVVLILAGFSTQALAKADTAFLTEAIQINLAEISVGDLAQKNGGSDDVKSFGKMLVDDHAASNTKATSLAQANGVTPPTEAKAADKQKHDELAKLSGADSSLSSQGCPIGGKIQPSRARSRRSVPRQERHHRSYQE